MMRVTSIALGLSLLALPAAFAADKTWDGGGGSGSWSNGTNWNANTAPVATDSLFFAGATQTTTTNDFAAFTQFNGLTFNSGANSFTLNGNEINLAGNITNSSGNNQTINLALALQSSVVIGTGTRSISVNGAITGAQTITINGGASDGNGIYLNAASRNTFSGSLAVNGYLYAGTGMNVSAAKVDLGSAGTLDMRAVGSTVGGLAGSAGSTVRSGSGTRTLTIVGSGTNNFGGDLSNGGGTTELWVMMNYGAAKGGVQTLSGNNTFTGRTFLDSGKLVLDYSANNTSKLSDATNITARAGTIELAGGSHTEVVNGLTLSGSSTPAGMVNIVRSSGTSTLSLGAIAMSDFTTGGGGAINFSAENIATTTTALVNGLLSTPNGAARITVGGANWATTNAGSIVAFTSYSAFVQSGGTSTANYLLNGGSSLTGNVSFNTLKISSSTGSAQTLALGTRSLGLNRNGLLLTGSDDYAITADTGFGLGSTAVHNYLGGTLTLGPTTGILEHYGSGKMVLTGGSSASTAAGAVGLRLGSGTLQFSSNSQLSGNGNLVVFGGTLVADTSGGNISLANNSVSGFRDIALGSDVPVFEVIGGGTLTIGGVISTAYGNPNQFASPVVFGSSTTSGTFVVTGNNTYNGDTRLVGGKLAVNSATSLGSTNNNTKFIFGGNSTLNTITNITTSRYYDINSGVTGTIETDANTTLTHNGTIAGAGTLNKSGAGTLTLGGTNTHTGGTTVSAGVLKLGASEVLVNSGAVTVSGGTFDLGAFSETVGDVTLTSGTITNGTLTGSSYAVQSGSVGAVLAGSGVALAKTGSGTVTLTASNTYTGTTTVSDGKLAVNGSIASSAVTVTNAGVLGGSGLVGSTTIGGGGTIAPGNSPGTLSINGDLAWTNGGNYDWEIFSLADSPGTSWDLINVSGNLDLTNLAGPFNINLFTLSDSTTPGPLAGFNSSTNYAWKILGAGMAIGSFSTNKFNINTAGFLNDTTGGLFALELRNDSKDLYLTYTGGSEPIPEPGTWAAALLLLGAAALLRYRRRRPA